MLRPLRGQEAYPQTNLDATSEWHANTSSSIRVFTEVNSEASRRVQVLCHVCDGGEGLGSFDKSMSVLALRAIENFFFSRAKDDS